MKRIICMSVMLLVSVGSSLSASADIVEFMLEGNAGVGLLPGNNVPVASSAAFGGEVGSGITYDTDTRILSLIFDFQGLTGGLADLGDGGIHVHVANEADPFDSVGGILLNLNPGASNIALGSTSGSINASFALFSSEEPLLFNRRLYINIHSVGFNPGELRGNLVPAAVPEPASGLLVTLCGLGLALCQRKRK